MNFFKWLFKRNKKPVKLGLALGSGGAKGFAELGAIAAFEENGISFDMVAGTSIGSIIGALYADGYSSTDMLELLKRIDFSELKRFTMINMDTAGIFKIIDNIVGCKNIEELKKPFYAVATEVESGEEKVFNSGSVAKALCASASYPPFFKPVVIDGKRYVDGAFNNSVPADLLKNNGADYVVGIDLSVRDGRPTVLSKIFPTYTSRVSEPWAKGYKYSDTMLHPDLSGYKPTSIGAGNEMFDIGYECAIKAIPKIKQDLKLLR